MQTSPFPFSITGEPIGGDRPERFSDEAPYIHQHVKERNKPNLKKVEHFFKKWNQWPEVWNWYYLALLKNNRKTEADKLLQMTIDRFPDYLFARVNQAKKFIKDKQTEKALEWVGETPDLQRLFPERTVFHTGEVINYYSVFIELELERDNIDKAEEYLQLFQDMEDMEDFVEQYQRKIMDHRILKMRERLAKYRAATPEYIKPEPPAGYSHQPFIHPEIEKFLEMNEFLDDTVINNILSLPRETAIKDLEQILFRTLFEYTEEDYDNGNYYILPHAVWFLYAFEAVESAPLIQYLLLMGDETREYWYGDVYNENTWFIFFLFIEQNTHPHHLFEILYKPNLNAYSKTALTDAMEQMAYHHPERRQEVIGWFDDLLQFYIDNREDKNILDATMVGAIEYIALNLRATELLPKLKILHEMECIDEMMCGDYEMVEEEMNSENDRNNKQDPPSIYTLAKNERQFFDNINKTEEEEERRERAKALMPPTLSEPKAGRNDPCPCGSGKKFKKCCRTLPK